MRTGFCASTRGTSTSRRFVLSLAGTLPLLSILACSSGDSPDVNDENGGPATAGATGGATSGGQTNTGGDPGTGGATGTGGAVNTGGGLTASGGGAVTGGATSTGGTGTGTGGIPDLSTEITIEEGGLGQCEVDGVIESTHTGFTGSGYLNTDNFVGAGIEWAVNVGEAGTYTLEIAYANEPAEDRPGDVLVGGEVVSPALSFPSTSSWLTYSTVSVEVTLAAGENRIAIQATTDSGLGNIDSLTVTGTAVSAFDCGGVSGTGGDGTGGTGTGGTGTGGTGTGGTGTGGTGTGGTGTGGQGPVTEGATIYNDTFWRDTSGTHIYSQGGGILQVGDTYYWYGVHYAGAPEYIEHPEWGKNGNIGFVGVTTYSSTDLVNWTHEATDAVANAGGWFGRLGVAYNENTEKYVLIAQTWNEQDGNAVYFATSDSPAGGFVYDNIQSQPPGIANGGTGDQTIFIDTDGKAYMVSSSQEGRSNRYISPLRESDYLAVEDAILVYRGNGREGNCMFKHEGTYYYCSSDLHGWNTSQTYCVTSQSIYGPWSDEFVMRNSEKDYSHVTQAGFFIHVYGTEQTTIIYAGDRWADFAGNGIGFNQWVPISFEGTEPIFNSLSAWTLNATTGEWAVAPENNWVLNPTFEADRIDVTNPVGWNSSSGWNEQDGRTGRWSWNVNGSGSVSQLIEDLPDGTYNLRVWTRSSSSGGQLFVSDYGGSEMTTTIPSSGDWTQVSVEGIVATAGQARVGVRAGGQTVSMDDFTMVLDGY